MFDPLAKLKSHPVQVAIQVSRLALPAVAITPCISNDDLRFRFVANAGAWIDGSAESAIASYMAGLQGAISDAIEDAKQYAEQVVDGET